MIPSSPRIEVPDARAQLLALGRFAHHERDLIGAEGLLDVIVGTAPHRGDRRIGVAVGAHGDDKRGAAELAMTLDELEAIHGWHPHIAEHQIPGLLAQPLERGRSVLRESDGVRVIL
jgi:hypothetical protein